VIPHTHNDAQWLTVLDGKEHDQFTFSDNIIQKTTFCTHNTTGKFDHSVREIQINEGQIIGANDIYQYVDSQIHNEDNNVVFTIWLQQWTGIT